MQNVSSMKKNAFLTPTESSSAQALRLRQKRATFWVSLGSLFIIIPLVILSITIIIFQVFQLILPGVFIFDKEVSMMSREETAGWIDDHWNQDRQIQVLTSMDPDVSYWLTPQELGFWVDPEATANAAYNIGRTSDPLPDIVSAASGQAKIVLPVLYYDSDAARETLETLVEALTIPAVNATLAYRDGTWVAVPGSKGQSVDIEATLDHLSDNAFTILLTQSAMLQLEPVSPDVTDLMPVLDEIDAVVSQELVFQAYDPITDENLSWSVPMELKRTWINIDVETYQVQLAFNREEIEDTLHSWEGDLGEGRSFEVFPAIDEVIESWENGQPSQETIHHDPTTYRVGAGESLWSISLKLGMPMWHIMNANDGLTTSNLETGMNLTIPSKNVLLPLPVIPNKRIVIDISEQLMTVYENGQLRNTYIISTGVSNSPTMAGIFQIQTHEINAYASNWDLYMPHFMGIYEAWPGFMNGIHGLPLLSSGQRLWASTLGSPASYGCIILDLSAAEDLYTWADPGVVVEIIN